MTFRVASLGSFWGPHARWYGCRVRCTIPSFSGEYVAVVVESDRDGMRAVALRSANGDVSAQPVELSREIGQAWWIGEQDIIEVLGYGLETVDDP